MEETESQVAKVDMVSQWLHRGCLEFFIQEPRSIPSLVDCAHPFFLGIHSPTLSTPGKKGQMMRWSRWESMVGNAAWSMGSVTEAGYKGPVTAGRKWVGVF